MAHDSVVFQIKCRNFSFLLMKSISLASKLRQSQLWRTKICAAKIRKFSRISEKSAASAKDLKNPRYRIVLVNDLLQIGFSPALPSSSISASSFDLNNYIEGAGMILWPRFRRSQIDRRSPATMSRVDTGFRERSFQTDERRQARRASSDGTLEERTPRPLPSREAA